MNNSQMHNPWMPRGATVLLWSLAAASAFYWGSRMAGYGSKAAGAPATVPLAAADNATARQAGVARLLGAMPAVAAQAATQPAAAERFVLLGVIASVTGKGAALISVDREPARPLNVGAQIAPGYVLESVGRREAVLVDGAQVPVKTVLSLPALETSVEAAPPPGGPAPAALATRAGGVTPAVSRPAAATPPALTPRPDSRPPPRQDSRYQPRSPIRP